MSSLAPRLIVSEEEFLSLPESTEKVELVDGFLRRRRLERSIQQQT
jgi:hypothetical protein